MSAMYRQVLLDLPLFTNFTEDLKTQKPTKSSISLLKSANREIKAQKGKGGVRDVLILSYLSAEVTFST